MAKNAIALNHEALNKLVSKQLIFDALCVQQGLYMRRKNLQTALITPRALKQYAKGCYAEFKAQRAACTNEREHKRLNRALMKRMNMEARRPEFLNAIPA